MERTVLRAEDGMVFTDGVHAGRVVYLPQGGSADGWYQLPAAEFAAMQERTATEEDYRSALREFGVVI